MRATYEGMRAIGTDDPRDHRIYGLARSLYTQGRDTDAPMPAYVDRATPAYAIWRAGRDLREETVQPPTPTHVFDKTVSVGGRVYRATGIRRVRAAVPGDLVFACVQRVGWVLGRVVRINRETVTIEVVHGKPGPLRLAKGRSCQICEPPQD
jgi:hypothetical protein